MIHCKKHIIAACFTLILPLAGWAEAPVVDDSDNFAMLEDPMALEAAPLENPKYDEQPLVESEAYASNQDTGSALVKEEAQPKGQFNDNAQLIDKVATLQKEIQELRGQLEVQAHDLKLLQQQQLSFYKDLDSRLSTTASKPAAQKQATDLNLSAQTATPKVAAPQAVTPQTVTPSAPTKMVTNNTEVTTPMPITAGSRMNPADEQIGYLAAYELVKNKRYDDAIQSMQSFVQKYPNGGYTANAEYWLGELYLVKKDYSQAINHFETVLKKFPSSSKSAASMLKTGYAFAASGNQQEARNHLQQVIKNYPGTPTAQLASKKLESLN